MTKIKASIEAAQVGIVMPVYNEAETLREIVETVLRQPCVRELVIIDDASTDGTWVLIEELFKNDKRVRKKRHDVNQGKGAALQTGFSMVKSPIIIVQDADLEYDPTEYPVLIKPIIDGRADVVLGSRFTGAGAHRVLYFWHSVGNKFLTTLSNMFTDLNLTDMETCYKVFKKEVLDKVEIKEKRFGFEPEIVAKVSRLGVSIYEVPISYYGRTYAEGKKIGWRDGVNAFWCIFKYALLRH
jgi:glycosyltransferase involved in cell wall biosynthesis